MIFRGFFLILFISGCASGGGNSPPTGSAALGTMTPPTSVMTTPTPGAVPGTMTTPAPMTMNCRSGLHPAGNQCVGIFEAVEYYFNSLDFSLPCGASRARSDIPDKTGCSRSLTPGLTQLAQASEAKRLRDLSEGNEIPKLHAHDDAYIPNEDGTSTHGERSEAVVQQLGGGHLFERVSNQFVKIETNTFDARIVSSGFGSRLACSSNSTCPSDILGLQSILVLPAGNRRGNQTPEEPVDVYGQGSEEDIRDHIEANTPFLLVVGYENSSVVPIVDSNGRHLSLLTRRYVLRI